MRDRLRGSQASKARPPEFPVRTAGQDRVCAFLHGKAHKVRGTHESSQEIGDLGHPSILSFLFLLAPRVSRSESSAVEGPAVSASVALG
jgi:hypothetical protein